MKILDKFLVFNVTDENKELLKKYDDVFNEITGKIKKIDDDWLEYSKGYKKIKLNSDDNLPLNKPYCHYWYYLNKNFSHGPFTCDGYYNMVQRSTDFKNVAIVHLKNNAYRIYFKGISKHKVKKLMNKFDLIGKTGDIYCND